MEDWRITTMTDEDIVELSKRCGAMKHYFRDELLAFSKLIIEHQREIDASICDELYYKFVGPGMGETRYGVMACAKAIRKQNEE
jgi:hypothetical protein